MWNNLFVSVFWLLFCLSVCANLFGVCVFGSFDLQDARTHRPRGILFAVQGEVSPAPSRKENTIFPNQPIRGRVCVVPNFRPLFYLGVILSCGVCRRVGGMCWSYNSVDWFWNGKAYPKAIYLMIWMCVSVRWPSVGWGMLYYVAISMFDVEVMRSSFFYLNMYVAIFWNQRSAFELFNFGFGRNVAVKRANGIKGLSPQ